MEKNKTICAETIIDKANEVWAKVTADEETGIIGLTVQFSQSGIYRSRAALIAAVAASVDLLWDKAYHALFGAEAADYIPSSLIEEADESCFRFIKEGSARRVLSDLSDSRERGEKA